MAAMGAEGSDMRAVGRWGGRMGLGGGVGGGGETSCFCFCGNGSVELLIWDYIY